jgi:hypothetical protein
MTSKNKAIMKNHRILIAVLALSCTPVFSDNCFHNFKLLTATKMQSISCQLPTADCQLPSANCQFQTADCQLFKAFPKQIPAFVRRIPAFTKRIHFHLFSIVYSCHKNKKVLL